MDGFSHPYKHYNFEINMHFNFVTFIQKHVDIYNDKSALIQKVDLITILY